MLFSQIGAFLRDGTYLSSVYVFIEDGMIRNISQKPPKTAEGPCYDGRGKLLLPGLVNTHCHAPMTLLRSVGTDLPLMRWLHEAIFPIEKKFTNEWASIGTTLAIAEMLRSGVTSFSDMYIIGEARASAILEAGIKANLCMGIVASEGKPLYFEENRTLYDLYHNAGNGRLKIEFGLHAEYSTDPDTVRAVGDYAREKNTGIQLHLSETAGEVTDCIRRHGMTPPAYFESLGVLENRTTAAHCVHLQPEDLPILARHPVFPAHCPMSNLKLGSGMADIVALRKANIPVTLGTDGTASNDNLNFLEDIKLAGLLQKGLHRDPTLLSVTELLDMATRQGALAQGRENTGAIAEGMCADLCVIDFNSPNLVPKTEPLSNWIYAGLPGDVVLTMVDGRVLYQDGAYLTLDIEQTLAKAKEIGKKLYGNV